MFSISCFQAQAPPPTITLRRPSQTCQEIQASQTSCLQTDDIFPKCTDLQQASQPTTTTTTTAGGEQQESSALICFCGFYSEKPHEPHQASLGRGRKVGFNSYPGKTLSWKTFSDLFIGKLFQMGRCKFCRSKAKYLPGQGSLDAMSSR